MQGLQEIFLSERHFTEIKMNTSILFNSSNLTNSTEGSSVGYTTNDIIAHGLISLFLWLPPFVLEILLAVALVVSRDIKRATKVTLLNIVASSIIYALGLHFLIFWYVPRGLEPGRQPDSCVASLLFQLYGGNGVFFSLMLYGAVMYVLIRKGVKAITVPVLVVIALLPWILSLPSAVAIFFPTYGFVARENARARCGYSLDPLSAIIHTVYNWVIVGLGSCIVTASLTIASYCYVKKQAYDDMQLSKGLYRLAGFLTISAFVLVICQLILPTIFIYVNVSGGIEDKLQYYIPVSLFALSLWAIPISMATAFKPLRTSLLRILTFCFVCTTKNKVKTVIKS